MIPDLLTSELVPIDSLITFPGNPRRGDVEAIVKSLRAFGQTRPIIVQRSTGYIVGGNHVWAAAKLLEWTEINAVYLDLDDTEARRVLLADNQISTRGQNDPDALTLFLQDLAARSAIDDALGFTSHELDIFLAETVTPQGEADIPVPRETTIQTGQMFQLGRHRVLCGDATDPAAYERLMGGESAGMIWTDPPYGVDYEGGTEERLTIANDDLSESGLKDLLDRAFRAMLPNLRKGRAVYVAAPSGGEMAGVFTAVLREHGVFRQTLVWVKDQFAMGRSDYHYRHEFIHYGWRPGASHYFVKDRTLDTVLEVPRPKVNREHPCLPPVELVLTDHGWVSIGDVAVDDRVLAHDGNWHPIREVTRHPFSGDLIEIAVEASPTATTTTGNHPYLISRGGSIGWVDASEVRVGDYAMTPVVDASAAVPVDPEWAWALGLWAAEGSTLPAGHGHNFYLVWTLHDDESALSGRLRAIYPSLRSYRNGDHAQSHMLFDPVEAARYVALVGKGARAKWLHPNVQGWQVRAREELLQGYLDGVGWRLRQEWRAKTASRNLATSIQLLAEGLGRSVGIRRYTSAGSTLASGRRIRGGPYYDVTVSDNPRRIKVHGGHAYALRRIKAVRDVAYEGDVVNLSVEGAHTFQTVAGMTHNTMKPVALVEQNMLASSLRGDVILDPFAGSGTTLIAADAHERTAYLLEIDPRFVQVIIERWQNLTGGTAEPL